MAEDHDEREVGPAPVDRSTAPQSEYSNSDVARGLVVLLLGLAIVFGIPLLLG